MRNMRANSSSEIQNIADAVTRNIRALKILKQPTDKWDAMLIYLISTKLKENISRAWEKEKARWDNPILQGMLEFLASRAEFLQTLEFNKVKVSSNNNIKP